MDSGFWYSKEEYFFDPLQEVILETITREIIVKIERIMLKNFDGIHLRCGRALYQYIRLNYSVKMNSYRLVMYSHDYHLKNDQYHFTTINLQ